MKRLFFLLVVIIVLIQLCACSPTPKVKASQKAISIANRAVRLLDDYLDGNIGGKEANDGMDELRDQIAYASEYAGKEQTPEQAGDLKIYFLITTTAWDVSKDGYCGNSETYEKVVNDRNDIAGVLGIKDR